MTMGSMAIQSEWQFVGRFFGVQTRVPPNYMPGLKHCDIQMMRQFDLVLVIQFKIHGLRCIFDPRRWGDSRLKTGLLGVGINQGAVGEGWTNEYNMHGSSELGWTTNRVMPWKLPRLQIFSLSSHGVAHANSCTPVSSPAEIPSLKSTRLPS